jgi:hypothetical protein
MTKARLDGLYLLLLGSVAFLLLSTVLANTSSVTMVDFRGMYFPARCLIHHGDPYNENELLRMTIAETGDLPEQVEKDRGIMRYIYPPTVFALTIPFAMLAWGPAHILWTAFMVGSLIFASFLIWNLGADYAPIASGALIGFFLFNSELVIVEGNMAGIAISFCAIAVWCFLRERHVPVGILCLAIALAVKPHDTGLVWLYFLFAGGTYRKRALQTLAVAAALSLPGVLWVWHVAPHWIQGLDANLRAYSVRGGATDPGPTSSGGHGLGMMINLQTVISVFWDDPRIYDTATYLVCGPLLIIWSAITLRFRSSTAKRLLALATIAALSMLPVYHRQQDAMLLLLTVPACAMLCAEGGLIGRLALVVNTVGFILAGDFPWVILFSFIHKLHMPVSKVSTEILIAVQVFPIPLILLAMTAFYLWVYVWRSSATDLPVTTPSLE